MKKIKCVFKFNDKHQVTAEPNPETEWVLEGEGVATRKWDGIPIAIIDGNLYTRYDCKPSKRARRKHKRGDPWGIEQFKDPPSGAIPCQEPDLGTGHWPHWVPVGDEPQYKWIRKAYRCASHIWDIEDGTYEAVGPKINGNPEGLVNHTLVTHGGRIVKDVPRDFDGLREFLKDFNGEGIVFHHEDGRMAKIRRADFGFDWPIK
jgi:hypothetical protein